MARDHDEVPRDLGLLIRRGLLRTDRTALRPLWRGAHELLIRTIAFSVRRRLHGATVYVRGSFGFGEPVFGVSDVDLVIVVPHGRRPQLEAGWRRAARRFPRFGRLFRHVATYEDEELATVTAATALTNEAAVVYGERPPWDLAGLLVRPGLAGPARSWRRVAGPERRRPPARWDADDRRVAGWLELQHWWQYAFAESLSPALLEHPSICVRLVAEPARIWLALAHDEHPRTRSEVLERTRRRLPDEEATLAAAVELLGRLSRRPHVDISEFLPFVVRQSGRIAQELERRCGERLAVALAGRRGDEPPLVDFRALTAPRWAEEKLVPRPGSPAEAATLRAAAAATSDGRQPVLRAPSLLVLPTSVPWPRAILRGVQCSVTDPVSFAVLDGREVALFAREGAWSAQSWARRAITEHRAWLAAGDHPPTLWAGPQPSSRVASAEGLGRLLTAARASLFLQSLDAGSPVLPLTLDEVASALATPVAGDALSAYRAGGRDQRVFDALARTVRRLPAFS